MSSERPLLMIPGPVEMSADVLEAAATHSTAHIDPHFIAVFASVLQQLRRVFLAPDGQPFVVAGSGSLGWDMFGFNVLEEGDECLLLSSGYFGLAFAEYLTAQGVRVTTLSAPPGEFPSLEQISSLDLSRFRAACVTHVDTSTAVLAPVRDVAALLRAKNPSIIIAVDAVAALGGEELRTTDWDIDFVMSASQKALGAPAGLSISIARPRALQAAASRKTPVRSLYVSWAKWRPIMEAYEALKPSYFATPAVPLILALDVALKNYLANGGTDTRFAQHRHEAEAFRAALTALGLRVVATHPLLYANTLTGVYFPANLKPLAENQTLSESFRGAIKRHGAIVSGGLHKDIGAQYFRVGHMGPSIFGHGAHKHVQQVVKAIEGALKDHGYELPASGVDAYEKILAKY